MAHLHIALGDEMFDVRWAIADGPSSDADVLWASPNDTPSLEGGGLESEKVTGLVGGE